MKLEYLGLGKKCKILTGCFTKVIMNSMRHNYNRKSLVSFFANLVLLAILIGANIFSSSACFN